MKLLVSARPPKSFQTFPTKLEMLNHNEADCNKLERILATLHRQFFVRCSNLSADFLLPLPLCCSTSFSSMRPITVSATLSPLHRISVVSAIRLWLPLLQELGRFCYMGSFLAASLWDFGCLSGLPLLCKILIASVMRFQSFLLFGILIVFAMRDLVTELVASAVQDLDCFCYVIGPILRTFGRLSYKRPWSSPLRGAYGRWQLGLGTLISKNKEGLHYKVSAFPTSLLRSLLLF